MDPTTPPSDISQFSDTQQVLLGRLVEQRERDLAQRAEDLALRAQELEQQTKLAESNLLRAQADERLIKERAEQNRLISEQNQLVKNLIDSVGELLKYIKEGRLDNRLLAILNSQNELVEVTRDLIMVVLGQKEMSLSQFVERTNKAAVRDGHARTDSSTFRINNLEIEEAITNLLLECGAVKDNLRDVLDDMRPDVRGGVRQDGSLKVKVRQLVKACDTYSAWQELVNVIHSYDSLSTHVNALISYLNQVGKI